MLASIFRRALIAVVATLATTATVTSKSLAHTVTSPRQLYCKVVVQSAAVTAEGNLYDAVTGFLLYDAVTGLPLVA